MSQRGALAVFLGLSALSASEMSAQQGPFLRFPLRNKSPYTAAINTVFDHSMADPYKADGVVTAYTGEEGRSQYGQDYGQEWFGRHPRDGAG